MPPKIINKKNTKRGGKVKTGEAESSRLTPQQKQAILSKEIVDKFLKEQQGVKPKPLPVTKGQDQLIKIKTIQKGKRYKKEHKYYIDVETKLGIETVKWSPNKKTAKKNIQKAKQKIKTPLIKEKEYGDRTFKRTKKTKHIYRQEKITGYKNGVRGQTFYLRYRSATHRKEIIQTLHKYYEFDDFISTAPEERIDAMGMFITDKARKDLGR